MIYVLILCFRGAKMDRGSLVCQQISDKIIQMFKIRE